MQNKKITASLEDYLEAIYEIIEEKKGVRVVDIANKLNVRKSSVTEALKTLKNKGLVNYGRYDVISLTIEGENTAKNISNKHKFLYKFLKNNLGVSEDEASETACKMEHVISDNVLKKLENFFLKKC